MLDLSKIDNSWTLFLDRDGVINEDKQPYTLHKNEFIFYEGVKDALQFFAGVFKYIIITTNQRGVGRGLMTEQDLADIHDYMTAEFNACGGRIDEIYYCTSITNDHPNRKPNPGMILDAIKKYPSIKKEKSLIVGNNISDMEFGRNAGVHTVLLNTTDVRVDLPHPLVDMQFSKLSDFANALKSAMGS